MECNFTLKHYGDSIALALEKGYFFSKMEDHDKNIHHDRIIFLRHDVDIQINNALRFAEIEADLGVPSTFFFRLHTDYNMFSVKNYRIVRRILELGHEIGLHHEVDFAKLYDEDETEFFGKAKAVLEIITGRKVSGVTSHEYVRSPWKITDEILQEFGLTYNGYSPQFFQKIKYISDSGCRWREGCMCEFIKKDTPKLCILTHPVWWYDRSPIENY